MFMVDCLQREPQKIITILICTSSLYDMTLHLVPSRGREYFPIPWIWAVPVTCLDQQNMVEMMVVTSKSRPQETFQQLFLPSRSAALKLPESKSMKDHLTKLFWLKSSRSTSQQPNHNYQICEWGHLKPPSSNQAAS